MSGYAFLPLICAIFALILGLFVFLKNPKSALNRTFALLSFETFNWQICWFLTYFTNNPAYWNLIVTIGFTTILFIPFTYYHFVVRFLGLQKEMRGVSIFYLIGFIWLLLLWNTDFYMAGYNEYSWGIYGKAGILNPIYILIAVVSILRLLYFLARALFNNTLTAIKRNQYKFVFIASIFYALTAIEYSINYGVKIYPIGVLFILTSFIIIAYTIVRYRLMDINVVVTRAGIFIVVYTLVLGIPFAVGALLKSWLIEFLGAGWWMLPLGLMAVLATVGPFIYIYINRRAEERLLREQRRYQKTLKEASIGMTRIRNLRKLLDLITHIVTKTVRIAYAAVYLYNQDANEYVLQVSRDKGKNFALKISADNPLVTWVTVKREPLIYEEVKRQMEDVNDATFRHLEENMRLLGASVLIPSFLEDKFIGFIVLGEKLSGQIYTPDDLNVFEVLASQAALAIENAQFYEEAKEMQEQIAQAEKMSTLGTMADGLSHQINNRFYALSLIAGDTIDTIKLTDTSKCTPEVKEMISQINHALEHIQTNVAQGGEVVRGILKYTRKGEESFEAITLDQIIDGTLDMVRYKVRLSELDIVRNYSKDTPKIKVNLTQLQEVFFNFIDNAYDAIKERHSLLKEKGYRGRIIISTQPKDNILEITVEDNGMGMKDEDAKKAFTPFFTTKASSLKGTGLGLYVIQKIITDNHKGKISFKTTYKTGTRFIIELPIAK